MEPKIVLTMFLMTAIQLVAYFGGRRAKPHSPDTTERDLRAG